MNCRVSSSATPSTLTQSPRSRRAAASIGAETVSVSEANRATSPQRQRQRRDRPRRRGTKGSVDLRPVGPDQPKRRARRSGLSAWAPARATRSTSCASAPHGRAGRWPAGPAPSSGDRRSAPAVPYPHEFNRDLAVSDTRARVRRRRLTIPNGTSQRRRLGGARDGNLWEPKRPARIPKKGRFVRVYARRVALTVLIGESGCTAGARLGGAS